MSLRETVQRGRSSTAAMQLPFDQKAIAIATITRSVWFLVNKTSFPCFFYLFRKNLTNFLAFYPGHCMQSFFSQIAVALRPPTSGLILPAASGYKSCFSSDIPNPAGWACPEYLTYASSTHDRTRETLTLANGCEPRRKAPVLFRSPKLNCVRHGWTI